MTTEEALIRRLEKGDRKAFDHIYDIYARRLMAYCRCYIHSMEDVEDVMQDVFISLWNNRGQIRNRQTLEPLLLKSARNRVLNEIRRKVNSPVFEEYVSAREVSSVDSTSSHVEYSDIERMVLNAISALPPTQRKVVILSKFSNLSNKEIVERTGLSEHTVKNALCLGLKTLRSRLSGMEDISLLAFIGLSDIFRTFNVIG